MTTLEFNNNLIGMKSNLQRFAMSLTSDRDTALDLYRILISSNHIQGQICRYTNLKAGSLL
jgi:hypothetical protein